MLGSLTLTNYRAFERYAMTDLRRVNLIVGRNNCGKTSILEAAYLLATRGDSAAFALLAQNRHESPEAKDRTTVQVDISRFFRDGTIRSDTAFWICREADSLKDSLRVVATRKKDAVGARAPFEIHCHYTDQLGTTTPCHLWSVAHDGTRDIVQAPGSWFHRSEQWFDAGVFVGCDSLPMRVLNALWNRVARVSREDEVVDFVRLIAPDLRDFRFVVADEHHGEVRPTVLVGTQKGAPRTPLGSEGEGVRRLLGVGLALAQARDATVLIDEVDTGLHYLLLADFWKALVEAAKRSNSVVFATTHSSDCIRGLARMCEDHPELAGEVSLQKIDRTLDHSVPYHAPEIVTAVEQEIEVR